jgi:cysteine-rich repeat protein
MKRSTYFSLLFLALAAVVTGCGDDTTTPDPTGTGNAGGGGEGGGTGGTGGVPSVCGDGVVTGSEACDDDNTVGDDGCDDACEIEAGWECEGSEPSICAAICGDGLVRGEEVCDDGGTGDGDGCSPECTIDVGWSCDDAEPSGCTPDCGDGALNGAELCDDGNLDDEDGCSIACDVETGWACDDAMPSVCTAVCGDGVILGDEICDDDDADDGDGCSATCALEAGWECDGEPSACAPICGDGVLFSAACDDFNTDDGDGCSSACLVEPGFLCDGEPSVCAGAGDLCDEAIPLVAGANSVTWAAAGQDYLTDPPSCGSGFAPVGPDMVMKYTATLTGPLSIHVAKPANTRWHLLVSDAACGTLDEVACASNFTSTALTAEIAATAGTTYYVYVVDTASGPNPLDNPLDVTITEDVCGDGAIVGAGCDDGDLDDGDGCSSTCFVEPGFVCSGEPSVCVAGSGDTCADAIALTPGINTVPWVAVGAEYLTAPPVCGAGFAPDGPDIVMQFTASVTGEVAVSIDKPTGARWHLVVSNEACGTATPTGTCASNFLAGSLDGEFAVTAGATYFLYLVDSTSGEDPLDNPLQVTITETQAVCGDGFLHGEACDDGDLDNGDGCSSSCTVEPGFACNGEPSVCFGSNGENCSNAVPLFPGLNTVAWAAITNDYVTAAPSCGASIAPTGPDVVMQFTASVTGEAAFSVAKPASHRFHLLVSDSPCGTTTPGLCVSDATATSMGGTLPIVAGTTYFLYIVDTATGAQPLSNPLQVTITETEAICGDGLLVGEACDDGDLDDGDGCSSTCTIESGFTCLSEPSICVPNGTGDTCAQAVTLSEGHNTVVWNASGVQYITAPPTCSTQATSGPDVVMQFTATVTGTLEFSIVKPTSTRWHLLVSDAACGTTTPGVCVSDFTNPAIGGSLAATAGTTYFFYIIDTTSGTNPLSNPLEVDVIEQICGDGFIVAGEGCDDDNVDAGDGCSPTCQVEPGFVCNGEPSVCFVPPCFPGTNGMVGDIVSPMPTDLPAALAELYLEADDSPTGWLYIGGLSALHRVPKAGGMSQNVTTLAGLGTANLGDTMIINGNDIFTVEAKTGTTTGHLWRISATGGASWALTDYTTLPSNPNDTIQGVALDGGNLFLMTNEVTTTVQTQVFSLPSTGAPPIPATVSNTFVNEGRCGSMAMDDDFIYTACGTGERLVRVDRVTGAVTLLTTAFNLDLNANGVHAADVDADGTADYLYFKGGTKEIGYVCDPAGATPYVDTLVTFGATTSTTSYGLGFDPVTNTLWAFDDATEQIIIVQ